ncbi:MAG: DUF1501 domain-containing protein, partial [Planctomycetota bacterium]|nr:DUF1501 domain-containing protein [Planctomycetota bacterium]
MRGLVPHMRNQLEQLIADATRRDFLTSSASGLGGLALSAHLASELVADEKTPRVHPTPGSGSHFPGRAKACIFIYLAGAPSHLELYSPKPTLKKFNGQQLPDSLTKGVRFAFINKNATLMASKRPYRQHGECGMWFSDRLPHVSRHADDICMIQTMHSEAFNHHPAQMLMCCGQQKFGLPSMGAWLNYGLGAPSKNLPGYIVLAAGPAARGGATLYSNGFLPSTVAGVLFRSKGEPVLNLNNPKGLNAAAQRISLDALKDLNQGRFGALGDQEINSRIAAYELAFRMQSAAPDLIDLAGETKQT